MEVCFTDVFVYILGRHEERKQKSRITLEIFVLSCGIGGQQVMLFTEWG